MKKVLVRVLQSDIDEGVTCDPSRCPIARAVKRTLQTDYVSVTNEVRVAKTHLGLYGIQPYAGTARIAEWVMNPRVLRWRQRFDNCQPVHPFAFYLPVNA